MFLSKIVLLFVLVAISSADKRPNIVIIMADDAGWNDFGFHGQNQIPTPNLDALAYNGVVLNKFYTQQTCTPSRVALLTGNYPFRTGQQGIPLDAGEDRSLPVNMTTLPERLRSLGYSTHLIGKWHLGAARKSTTPTEKGFDSFFGYWSGWIGYYDYSIKAPPAACNITGVPSSIGNAQNTPCLSGFDLHDNFRPAWEYKDQYATTVFTQKAVQIINENKDEPFFLLLSHLAPHSGKDGDGMEVLDIEKNDQEFSYIQDVNRRRYAGMMQELDNSVGTIVKTLADQDILDNTIILFLSDNGPQTQGVYSNYGSAWPFRGLKFTPYEGGVRGSVVLYSPLIKRNGEINNNLMHMTDLYPTIYSMAGGRDSDLGEIDGINQWATIKGNAPSKRKDLVINIDEVNRWWGIIGNGGRFKLINGTWSGGLYDKYYGDTGRGVENPPYDTNKVLKSETNIAIENSGCADRILTTRRINSIRKRLDMSCSCNELRRQASKDFICKGLCLFDLQLDPCETTDISSYKPAIVRTLKNRLESYFPGVLPQKPRFVDPAADPKLCNGTWFLWKEVPPYCPSSQGTTVM